jgi:hypothetical protein
VTFHDQHINPMEEDFGEEDFFNQLNEEGCLDNFADLFELEGYDPGVSDIMGGGNGPGSPSGSPKGLSFQNNDGDDMGYGMGFGLNSLGGGQNDSRSGMDSHQQRVSLLHQTRDSYYFMYCTFKKCRSDLPAMIPKILW